MINYKADILIIGAGAAGLMAARILAKAGKRILILEARDRCGGRIHTIDKLTFLNHIELGAEFIHGDLPVTLSLLKEACIKFIPAGGEMLHFKNGTFSKEDGLSKFWSLLMKELNVLKDDISISAFLQSNFSGNQYAGLRKSVIRFASGYDTADPAIASSFALRQEWQNEDEGAQHRIEGGYGNLINYLEGSFKNAGGRILLNCIVKKIRWQNNDVEVILANGDIYQAKQVIVALPLGVLQTEDKLASIVFSPPVPEYIIALCAMGFGAIIKVLLEFKSVFWEKVDGANPENIGFILSEEAIPTWWTQAPQQSNVLTGWLGGPAAAEKAGATNEELLEMSLQSLSVIFKIGIEELRSQLTAYEIINWTADPFTLGSYAYDTVNVSGHRELLNQPVSGTIYFAGEYLYEGPAMGTVEAALTSGQQVARRIIYSS